ncbi:MAG: DUF5678 domain-containing protein [Chloroflexota bacterium]|nr:DUF5678 domain-containing protein [Chloroflexota bacterium]
MAMQITLTISERLYERASRLAQLRQQDVAEAIADYLDDHLPVAEMDTAVTASQPLHPSSLEQEKIAYIKMHTRLKEQHLGQHVAIYQGKLIDYDSDYGALYERIRQRYPREIVWLATVKEEPIETIHVRSPRFATEEQLNYV